MRTKVAFLLLTTAIAVAISFFARQQVLNDLRAGNETVRQQLDAQAEAADPKPAAGVQPTNAVADLSAEERNELLRLRGQILPLQSELQAASNRVAEIAQSKPERRTAARIPQQVTNGNQQLPPALQLHMQVMQAYRQTPAFTDAQGFGSALRKYLSQNKGQLPDDLAKVQAFGGPELPSGVSQRFELMHLDPIPEDARSYTLLAREKEPEQLSDGWLTRIYFFADGTMSEEGINSASPNWTANEQRMEIRAKARAQQGQGAVAR